MLADKKSRLQQLVDVLKDYLSTEEYKSVSLRMARLEPDLFWQKMRIEAEKLKIPRNPYDDRCVKIYALIENTPENSMKARMLRDLEEMCKNRLQNKA